MDTTPINERIQKLTTERFTLMERMKTPSGAFSHSVAARKLQGKVDVIEKALKSLAIPVPTERNGYNVPRADLDNKKWSNTSRIPVISAEVSVRINGLGPGTVVGYFYEAGFAGVIVMLYKDPAWHVAQCKDSWHAGHALVFGAEIDILSF